MVSTFESSESSFLRIIEERERSTFGAEFAFDLAGVVWNGHTRNYDDHDKLGANGDRLISRLIPLLHRKAEVRFLFGGGAETNFSWCIEGSIRDADSREDAEYLGASLRRGLRMVLASEPDFNFAPRQLVTEVPPRQAAFKWQTHLFPHRVCLRIPTQTAMGFAYANATPDAGEKALEMAVPRSGIASFHSLAEAVVLSPAPVLLVVSLCGFALDEKARAAVADTLKWVRANPALARSQLAVHGFEPDLGERLQEQMQDWLRNPTGGMVKCRIFSQERVADYFAQMLGSDVFGTGVESANEPVSSTETQAQCALYQHGQPDLDLTCCLHSDAPWPSLFPGLHSLAQARVERFFNRDAPVFGDGGVFLGKSRRMPAAPCVWSIRLVPSTFTFWGPLALENPLCCST